VLASGLLDRQQFILDIVLFNETGVLFFTNFAVELLKVVLYSASHHFLLHFRLVPLLQAVEVNAAATSTAFARSTQKFTQLSPFPQHTILALKRLGGILAMRKLPNHYLFVVHPKLGLAFRIGP